MDKCIIAEDERHTRVSAGRRYAIINFFRANIELQDLGCASLTIYLLPTSLVYVLFGIGGPPIPQAKWVRIFIP